VNLFSEIGSIFFYVFQEPIYNILMLAYGIFHSFWFSIVVMTLLLRTALIPLVFQQLRSSREMMELQPQLQEIQRKYRSEPQVMMQHQQALYKEHHVNPYASCLPLLVQLPFIYGLYGAFNSILRNHPTPHQLNTQLYPFVRPIFGPSGLTHLPDTHFFLIDLAKADPTHIMPVLAGLLTFMQLRMSIRRQQNQPRTTGSPDPNAMSMKMMQYIMPFFTLFIAWNFPAGLALYWIVTTGYSVVQQYFFNGRNFGGLFEGIPGLATLGIGAGAANHVVDSTLTTPPTRNRARVVEEKPADKNPAAKTKAPRGLPAPADLPPAKRPARADATQDGATEVTANGDGATNGARAARRPATKPATRTPTTPTKAARKDAVRLVTTPQTAGANGGNGNGSLPVMRVPKSTANMPRGAAPKPKPANSTRPKKKGR
jgi:YidC/Oxa1 family membrane protein insertase